MKILEISFKRQRPLNYTDRYIVRIVTEKYFYELAYRLDPSFKGAYYTGMVSTYGRVHRNFHGHTKISDQNQLVQHATRAVERHEGLMEGQMALA